MWGGKACCPWALYLQRVSVQLARDCSLIMVPLADCAAFPMSALPAAVYLNCLSWVACHHHRTRCKAYHQPCTSHTWYKLRHGFSPGQKWLHSFTQDARASLLALLSLCICWHPPGFGVHSTVVIAGKCYFTLWLTVICRETLRNFGISMLMHQHEELWVKQALCCCCERYVKQWRKPTAPLTRLNLTVW